MSEPVPSRRPGDLRLGRLVAWTAAITSLLGMIALLLVPPVAGLIGQLTWSDAAKDACEVAVPPCSPSPIPGYSLPAWVGIIWSAILFACVVVCWSPRRWWTPQDASGRPKRPGVYSTPEWLRGLAVVAAAVEIAMTWGVGRQSLPAPDYLWAALLAIAVVILASICIFVTAGSIPARTRLGLATGYSFWLLPAENRRRTRLARGEASRRERREASRRDGSATSGRRAARSRRDARTHQDGGAGD